MKHPNLARLAKSEIPQYSQVHPQLLDHPAFNGSTSVAMISADNPKWLHKLPIENQETIKTNGHNLLGKDLTNMGLHNEPTEGRYETPERSYLVYGASLSDMKALAKKYGQDSIVYMPRGHNTAHIHYSDLAEDPTGKPLKNVKVPYAGSYHFHPTVQPDDYYTRIPGKGYLRLNFDWDNPVQDVTKAEIREGLLQALKKAISQVS